MARRRAGFTLIELLVVIAIIGVLVSLLLPAVQAAREQARRTTCMNNLKQVGLALGAYVALHETFPPGYVSVWDPIERLDRGPGWGWGAMLLPHLEQQPLYDKIRFDVPINDPSHLTVRTTLLSAFLCPSDTMPPTWTATFGIVKMFRGRVVSTVIPICDVASSNYIGVFGIGEPGVDGEGVFFRGSQIGPRDITDGTSTTFALGERSTNLNLNRGQATWVGSVPGAQFWSCAPNPVEPEAGGACIGEDGSGMTLGHTGEGHGPGDPKGDINQFLSRHGRAAHFLYCDGHARLIQGSINYSTYKAMSTRDRGEIISSEF